MSRERVSQYDENMNCVRTWYVDVPDPDVANTSVDVPALTSKDATALRAKVATGGSVGMKDALNTIINLLEE